MRILNYVPVVLVLVIVGCEKRITDIQPIEQLNLPGILSLTSLEGLDKSSQVSNSSQPSNDDTIRFNLGAIKTSRNFYFILKNVGGNPITDINISSDNEKFEVSPTFISTLNPDSLSSIIPILNVGAVHGLSLNALGFSGVMNMGINSSIISITGLTSDDISDSILVDLHVEVSVQALVMDVRLYTDSVEIDLTQPDFMDAGIFNGVSVPLPQYVLSDSNNYWIVNTGNVPIWAIEYGGYSYNTTLLDSHFLSIGDTLFRTVDYILDPTYSQNFLGFSSGGTVCDQIHLRSASDGNAYIWLAYWW